MRRGQYVLACLSIGGSTQFSPVQLQKLFFLLERNIGSEVNGPHFDFEPYLYGPFDKMVYVEMDTLVAEGLVEKISVGKWNEYVLTDEGRATGSVLSDGFPIGVKSYVIMAIRFVKTLSFRQLVSAIYDAYPEMKKNSVFLE